MYKDVTYYNRSDKERNPRILEANLNGVRFSIHKHIYYGDQWLFTCIKFGIQRERLYTTDMEVAKKKGAERLRELLNKEMEEIQKALEQLEEYSEQESEEKSYAGKIQDGKGN